MDQVAMLLGWRLGVTQADLPLLRLRREPLGLGRLAYRLVSLVRRSILRHPRGPKWSRLNGFDADGKLDTCVCYPAHVRDSMLRLAERGLYRALWSADIFEELRRNLVEVVDPSAVDRLLVQMTAAFPDAEVTGYQSLIDGLTCDPKDGHVLAAVAVRANAGAIVTFNTTDSPDHSVEQYAIEVIHPAHLPPRSARPDPRRGDRRAVSTSRGQPFAYNEPAVITSDCNISCQ